jgi:DNA-directed RNA polymerase specialized sigma24 family protein
MFAKDSHFRERLWSMIRTLKEDTSHAHEDMFQEAMRHLLKQEPLEPDHTESWWIESCQYHIKNECDKKGTSVDARKRRHIVCPLDKTLESDDDLPPALVAENPVFEAVCAADSLRELAARLTPIEAKVLAALTQGHGVNETAERFGISRRTVLNYRHTFAATASEIGLAE